MGTKLQGGEFTVDKVLGQGGFSITYKGVHRGLQRLVAIKELFPVFASRSGLRVVVTSSRQEGFRREQDSVVREARVIANLDSHNIVDVYDIFHENGTVYIVMEYLEGPTLEQEIERLGKLPAGDVARLADEVCDALDTMHSTNLLHRDVKPANIMLARDGRVVLIDFGSAREFEISKTQNHTRLVTPNFAAPEQFSQLGRFGPYTDLFCLGATLYNALTGTLPASAMDRLQSENQAVTLPSSVPDNLRRAVQRALNFRVEDRPQTVEEFRALLVGMKASPARRTAVATIDAAEQGGPNGGDLTEFEVDLSHPLHNVLTAATKAWDTAIKEWVPFSYEYDGRRYQTPEDFLVAVTKDWETAIEKGYGGFEFNGRLHQTPEVLVAAVNEHWNAAVEGFEYKFNGKYYQTLKSFLVAVAKYWDATHERSVPKRSFRMSGPVIGFVIFGVILVLSVVAMVSAQARQASPMPTPTSVSAKLIPTATKVHPTFTPSPIPTKRPTLTLTSTPTKHPTRLPTPQPRVNTGANLRGGPGTDYPVIGGLAAGSAVEVVSRTESGAWLQLDSGAWIAAFLIDDAPPKLPISSLLPKQTSAPARATATRQLTVVPTPTTPTDVQSVPDTPPPLSQAHMWVYLVNGDFALEVYVESGDPIPLGELDLFVNGTGFCNTGNIYPNMLKQLGCGWIEGGLSAQPQVWAEVAGVRFMECTHQGDEGKNMVFACNYKPTPTAPTDVQSVPDSPPPLSQAHMWVYLVNGDFALEVYVESGDPIPLGELDLFVNGTGFCNTGNIYPNMLKQLGCGWIEGGLSAQPQVWAEVAGTHFMECTYRGDEGENMVFACSYKE